MGNVTIKDVARAADVSVATVSRALNGSGNVAVAVRERVCAAAQALRYTPHPAARSLSSRRTRTLGVVLPELEDGFLSELLRGINEATREQGLHLLVSSHLPDARAQSDALRAMRGRVDGVLLMAPAADAAAACTDGLADTPTVAINTSVPGEGVAALCTDNRAGAMAMVRHLVGRGHRRIAFIAGPDGHFDADGRLRGYREGLAIHAPGVAHQVVAGDFSEAAGSRAGRLLLASPDRPHAVFAANDLMALGCLSAFLQAGLRVPGDIALAGFGDMPAARYVDPALTTVQVAPGDLGRRAVSRLLAQVGPGSRSARVAGGAAGSDGCGGHAEWVPGELVVRASSAAPSGRG
ncbi:LacI family DNA-binding transcriptional regulator [Lysobacter sp. A3-1-A15]|uniref:LacI family DNA-binding transcriptional regulator n=1 Tax=Novilysobacter viscosus TaxID=3098602 RepID=UPI002ED93DEA